MSIAVVGNFNSGKSTLINQLLGQDLCPNAAAPTTAAITRFRYGNRLRIRAQTGTGERWLSQREYQQRARHGGLHHLRKSKTQFQVFAPVDILKHVELVDTPGFENPEHADDARLAHEALKTADALLYLLDINNGELTSTQLQRLKKWQHERERPMLLILNKADKKPFRKNRDRQLTNMRTQHDKYFSKCILFSCKNTEMPGVSSVKQLRDELKRLSSDQNTHLDKIIHHRLPRIRLKEVEALTRLADQLTRVTGTEPTKASSENQAERLLSEFRESKLEDFEEDIFAFVRKSALTAEHIENSGWPWVDWFPDAAITINENGLRAHCEAHSFWNDYKDLVKSTKSRLQLSACPSKAVTPGALRGSTVNHLICYIRTLHGNELASSFDNKTKAKAKIKAFQTALEREVDVKSELIRPVYEALLSWQRKIDSYETTRAENTAKKHGAAQRLAAEAQLMLKEYP
jgi:small GTP-binding protein